MLIGDEITGSIKGDELYTPGVNWGRPLKILKQHGDYVLIKRAGHMTWSGRGSPQVHEPTMYAIFRVKHGVARLAAQEEPGRHWKPALARLTEELSSIEEQTDEDRNTAVEKLVRVMWLYPNYRVDSRGPSGLILDAIEALRPDIAKEIQQDRALDDILEKHFPE